MARFNPLNHPICFSQPQRIVTSAWIGHLPFAFTLIDILRPRTIVELGTFTGVSYCAFCQAIKELQIETRCFAIDTWRGDEQTGFYGDEVLQDLRTYHDERYSDFSTLVQTTFDSARLKFEDASIDLIHIDGLHRYEQVKHDFQSWLPKLSERGVVVFHDICERQANFGVWKLWDELKLKYPTFEFHHAHGLGIVATGTKIHPELAGLFALGDAEKTNIRSWFESLGMRLVLNLEKAALIKKLSDTEEQVAARDLEKVAFVKQLADAEEQVAARDRTISECANQSAQISSELGAQLKELYQRHIHLSEHSRELEGRHQRILDSRAWRWVNRYGRIKRYIFKPKPVELKQTAESSSGQTESVGESDDLVPPPELQAYIGGGFERVGSEFLNYFRDLGGLQPHHRVLDVGCGSGRMAVPLTKFLSGEGSYEGFDISAPVVNWCTANITRRYPNFRFQVADLCNPAYNLKSKRQAADYVFPFDANYFDLVFLTSVFTHMKPRDMEAYAAQIARVLKPNGKCLITFFLLNPESRGLMREEAEVCSNSDSKRLNFQFIIEHGCQAVDAAKPEDALAYDETLVRQIFAIHNLRVDEPIHYGSWCGRKPYLSFQDIVIATKASPRFSPGELPLTP
jgi:SAM-dependent methyltransferase